jgi:hypothetical protein
MLLIILLRGTMSNNVHKWNKWWIGWVVGVISPVIGFFILYLFDKSYRSLHDFIFLSYQIGMISKILSISLLANFAGFYFFLNKEWYYSVRGIILGMMSWGVVILYFRFTIPNM